VATAISALGLQKLIDVTVVTKAKPVYMFETFIRQLYSELPDEQSKLHISKEAVCGVNLACPMCLMP
jgi:hypothetical protein